MFYVECEWYTNYSIVCTTVIGYLNLIGEVDAALLSLYVQDASQMV